ncbi:MAG: hypothetical protein GXX10_04195 [Clostridiaceae bacterium]|nr:hypothetical protein [Clostridiaceae bacterium]
MKRKLFYVFLTVEAVLCILLNLARENFSMAYSAVISFPFEQIGLGLRKLSLSGDTGNIAAIVLYSAICLIPLVLLLIFKKSRKLYPEDALLALLSPMLFGVMYLMINPGLMGPFLGSIASRSFGKAVLGSMVYSVIVGYIILRLLRIFNNADITRLHKYLSILLGILNVLFVCLAFGDEFMVLLDSMDALRAGNIGNEKNLGMSYIFLTLKYTVNILPYILDVFVAFTAMNLLNEMRYNRYSEATVNASAKLSLVCRISLAITVISNIIFNLLQLVFFKTLLVIQSTVQIPLISIAFILITLLLSQYIRENKQLKDDNDMFI